MPDPARPISSAPRLLFASYHCYVDSASGAAIATRDLLEMMVACGWDCRVLCGPILDVPRKPRELMDRLGTAYRQRDHRTGGMRFSMLHSDSAPWQVPVDIYVPERLRVPSPTPPEGENFLGVLEQLVRRERPDLLLTYGGQWVTREIIALARRRNVAVVFALHNFAYKDPRFFEAVMAVLVPSRFAAEYHQRSLGIECTAIPSPINWDRIRCEPDLKRQYVTFVNPDPNKGVFIFARIAQELQARRPDIPLLIVEGRGGLEWLGATGLDWSGVKNLSRMRNTPDPRNFYRVSRLLLMPSLWNESFGRVAAEATINGIPVLASDRGALPEVLANSGFILRIPDPYTPDTRFVPTRHEVEPWLESIIRLWDDDKFYESQRERCLEAALVWQPEAIASAHDRFFRSLI